MSKVYADKIEPRDSSMDVTIGTSTNTVTLAGNDLRANTVKDSGGNTLWTSDGSGNLSSVNSGLAGNLVLLSTQTASAASSVSFTSDIDDTYDVYIFKFISIHPQTNSRQLAFQGSTDGGSNYNTTITSTFYRAYQVEDNSAAGLTYQTAYDLAQATGYQWLTRDSGNESDESCAGELFLFNPSNTVYVKHFYSTFVTNTADNQCHNSYVGGYFNTTSAVNAIDFKMYNSSTFDGTIKMYGLL